jgi:hypothetical protein
MRRHPIALRSIGDKRYDGNDGFIDSLVLVQVPEPASVSLLAAGAIILLGRNRRLKV